MKGTFLAKARGAVAKRAWVTAGEPTATCSWPAGRRSGVAAMSAPRGGDAGIGDDAEPEPAGRRRSETDRLVPFGQRWVGVTGLEGTEEGPVPTQLVAVTVNVYVTPLVRPVTVAVVAVPLTVAVLPPGDDVAV